MHIGGHIKSQKNRYGSFHISVARTQGGSLDLSKKSPNVHCTRNPWVSRKNCTFTKTKAMRGLKVQNGRLINETSGSMTGIDRVAQIKKAMKRQEKISMMVDAMRRKDMMDQFTKDYR